jgi:Domain of unknown function (DUF4190)
MAQPAMPPMAPSSSGLAITSMICGILGLCVGLLGVVAVICGHIALSQIKSSAGRLTGRGMALTGLILGYIEIALMLLIIIFLLSGGGGSLSTTP